MASWMHTRAVSGWTAVSAEADGIYGVSVAPPRAPTERPQVVSTGFVPGGSIDADSLAALAKQVAVQGYPWTLALGRDLYKILVVAEPAVKPDEIGQSVRWAIGSEINYPVSDAEVAWMRIPTQALQPNRPPHMYVVVARRADIEECKGAFKQARLALQAVDVRETAHRNIAAMMERPGEGVALLGVDQGGVQLTVTFQGELFLDRYVKESLCDASLGDAARERGSERVVLQVQRSLDFISRSLPFIDIARLLLAPLPPGLNLQSYFTANLPVAVADIDLATIFDLSKVSVLTGRESPAGYFVALGAALRFMDK